MKLSSLTLLTLSLLPSSSESMVISPISPLFLFNLFPICFQFFFNSFFLDYDDLGGDDFMGGCSVPFTLSKTPVEQWIELESEGGILAVGSKVKVGKTSSKFAKNFACFV